METSQTETLGQIYLRLPEFNFFCQLSSTDCGLTALPLEAQLRISCLHFVCECAEAGDPVTVAIDSIPTRRGAVVRLVEMIASDTPTVLDALECLKLDRAPYPKAAAEEAAAAMVLNSSRGQEVWGVQLDPLGVVGNRKG